MVEEKKRYILEFSDIPAERQSVQELPVEERINNFNEVSLGFTEDAAVKEAKRCLSCRRCLGCGLCLAECDKDAIVFEQADEKLDISVDFMIITTGVERVCSPPPERFGYGRYANVVTDVEFERILSDNGPYVGLLIRPFDGEIPRKIGFVCWADNNEGRGESGIKSLSYAIHEAMLAKNKVDGLEISLFLPDNDDYIKELKRNDGKVPGVITKKGRITAIKEVQESKNLIVRWDENGNVREDEFEMLILSTMPEPTTYIIELAKRLDINLEDMRGEVSISLEAFDINKGGRRNHA
ncbi:MAG: hypothetical protein HY739_14225 [Desulfobacterales bacterium]|nr:hypothetical protein [Desulfobacterales bacterium]